MTGTVSNFLQGNPVYDYQNHDYVGAYVQDEWRVRSEPDPERRHAMGAVQPVAGDLRVGQPLRPGAVQPGARRARSIHRRPPAWSSPATRTIRETARRARSCGTSHRGWGPSGSPSARTSVRAAWGMFLDTPHLFFNTRFSNNPPWGAQLTITNPPGGFSRSLPAGTRAAIRSRRSTPIGRRPPSRRSASTSTRRSTWSRSDSSSGISPCSSRWATGCSAASYLGNHTDNLWRATELNPAVYGAGATAGNTNQRRELYLQNQAQGQFYGTIGEVDDTGRGELPWPAPDRAAAAEEQPQRAVELDALEVHERSGHHEITGPTIMNPDNPDADYCVLLLRPATRGQPVGRGPDPRFHRRCHARALQRLAGLTDHPLAERQPFDRHPRHRCRADWHGGPAPQSGARRPVRRWLARATT